MIASPREDRDANVTAVLGPTNTGKTHFAVERMLAHRSGVIGFPLRLLAREVYDRIVALRGPRAVALITGEEKIAPADAHYVVCTVESMPLDWGAEFLAVDEIQLCADGERGHVFTDRLLRARGAMETLFLGAESMRGRIQALIPKARFLSRPRFSTLSYAGSKKISRLPPRSAIVAFSVEQVYAIAELMRRQKGGCAVVMGALSPRTRNAQVDLYQNGDVEHLVATDAIGMGLNLDLKHVAFAGLAKFDGRRHRGLTAQEIGQIAGRAGRHTTDGSFYVTGEAHPLDEDVVEMVTTHRFPPAGKLQWRNARLEFGTVPALLASLEAAPPEALAQQLSRGREADDVAALRALWNDPETRDVAKGGAAVRLLWDVCQIPDFRKTHPQDHVALIGRIYRFLLADAGVIPAPWIEAQVRRLDRVDGDIDALSKRLAYVRTWTYVANRGRWLDDPAGWRDRTRAVEDRLSDALHDRLTQRFLDRRTSVLMRRLKQKERLVAEISEAGGVTVEGHDVGRLEGFRFRPDPDAAAEELKTLRAASLQALQAEFARRADRFYNAPDSEIEATEQGGLMWGADAVGRLEPGADQLSPQVRAFVDDSADPAVAEKVARRLGHWIERRVRTHFEPLIALRDDPALTGLARGVAFQLIEALGVIPRRQIAEDVKELDQESRALLRKHGVRFGQHHVFFPALLKPAPTRFRLLLWSLHQGFEEFPEAPPPGLVTIPAVPGAPEGFYPRAGYRLCGARAIRIDMLERLADMIRPLDAREGFEATPDMLSITGCTLDQFAELMKGLGYAAERGERVKPSRPSAEGATPRAGAATGETTEGAARGADAAPAAGAATPSDGATPREPVVTPDEPRAEGGAETAKAGDVAPADPAGAASGAAPEAARQATRSDAAEAAGEAAPSQEAGAAPERPGAAEAAAEASEAPAGEPETEVYFLFRQQPRRGPRGRGAPRGEEGAARGGPRRRGGDGDERRQGGRRGRDGATTPECGSAAPGGGARPARTEAGSAEARSGGKPSGRKAGGPKQDGPKTGKGRRGPPGPKRDDKPRTYSAPPPEPAPADDDNPFAVLKRLKDRM